MATLRQLAPSSGTQPPTAAILDTAWWGRLREPVRPVDSGVEQLPSAHVRSGSLFKYQQRVCMLFSNRGRKIKIIVKSQSKLYSIYTINYKPSN